MKSLLFALGLALCCLVQANQDKRPGDMDLSDVKGNHVTRAIITNCQKMKEMIPHMPASPVSFEQLSADELKMTMEMATPHGCKTMHLVLKREDEVLTTTCGSGGKKTVEYMNVDENVIFSFITVSHPKGQCKTAMLLTKDLSDIQEPLKEFRVFGDRHGMGGEKIHPLPTEGMCPRSS